MGANAQRKRDRGIEVKRVADELWRRHKAQLLVDDDGMPMVHTEPASLPWVTIRVCERDYTFGEAAWTWENDRYYGVIRGFDSGFFIDDSEYAIISFSRVGDTALRDFRDIQRIKNDLVGEEWEAIELYPAESRLVDPSNRTYLWAVPKGVLKFGLPEGRSVLHPNDAIAPQRPFPS